MITYEKSMRDKAKTNKEAKYLCSIDINAGEVRFQGPVTKLTAKRIGDLLLKLMKEKKI